MYGSDAIEFMWRQIESRQAEIILALCFVVPLIFVLALNCAGGSGGASTSSLYSVRDSSTSRRRAIPRNFSAARRTMAPARACLVYTE